MGIIKIICYHGGYRTGEAIDLKADLLRFLNLQTYKNMVELKKVHCIGGGLGGYILR